MNWEVFGLAVTIALIAKFASTRRMSPGQRQAIVIVAVGQGALLAWFTPRPLTAGALAIVALIYAGDFIGYQLGIGIDKVRMRYGQAIKGAWLSFAGDGGDDGLGNSGDQGADS